MKYCSDCAGELITAVPEGDNRERRLCGNCGRIHYENPRIVAGCLVTWQGSVLLCQRAIEPRRGYWTLPAGFLENGETTHAGAVRETWEEAQAKVAVHGLYTLFNLPHISQVYLFYRAELIDGRFASGDESLDVRLFDEATIPWGELAFPVVTDTLKHYFADRDSGVFPMRAADIEFDRDRRRVLRPAP